MGYRLYLKKIDLDEVKTCKEITKKEYVKKYKLDEGFFLDLDEYFFLQDTIPFKKPDYELGKVRELFYSELGTELFLNNEMKDATSSYNARVLTREDLLKIIADYKEKIQKYYQNLHEKIKDKEVPQEDKIKLLHSEIKYQIAHISENDWVDLRENSQVTGSWLFQYAIFNLVHLLKSINWEKESLIIYGW